jgi:hypothetical protein
MLKVDILFLLSISLFFLIHFSYTQKIYSNNSFKSFLVFVIIFPLLLLVFNLNQHKEDIVKLISFGAIFPIYYLLLLLLKKNYKKLNKYFIFKNWINEKYTDKDFTFVNGGDGIISEYWDEKLATKPSWLDNLITFLLLILPIALIPLIYILISAIFN